jgi:hypothetical protein
LFDWSGRIVIVAAAATGGKQKHQHKKIQPKLS